ncbi:MAG: hypothetical protein AABZ23_02040 [Deltaproteobacteria bacterium]
MIEIVLAVIAIVFLDRLRRGLSQGRKICVPKEMPAADAALKKKVRISIPIAVFISGYIIIVFFSIIAGK